VSSFLTAHQVINTNGAHTESVLENGCDKLTGSSVP